jgi:hypothetical protein
MREHEDEREPATQPATQPAKDPKGNRKRDPGDDWADQASKARTGDDPRAVAPRDAAGIPSTGSTTGRDEHR